MRDDPQLDTGTIAASLETQYGIAVASITYLPIGYDLNAAAYRVGSRDGGDYFLKIRFGPVHEPGLLAPRALIERGVRNVLAPLPTRSSALWCPLDGYDGYTIVLYPFIQGENAMIAGMSDDQWREFGATLRAVHASGLETGPRDQLRMEDFALPSAALVRHIQRIVDTTTFEQPTAQRFGSFWRKQAGRIEGTLARAEERGRSLQSRSFACVLCHADIHAANILVGDDGQIRLIDWDGPLIAPRERDLLFVVGSRIARAVAPREEDLFFEGYGPAEIDRDALVYYRYERLIEDIGEIGKSVLLDPHPSEQARTAEAELAMRFFAPDGDLDRAENGFKSRA